jgi:hypothetical protein
MALDPITMLLMVREEKAQERRDLISDCCDHDAVTGQPILATLERWLEQIDACLIAAGTDPQPQPQPAPSNVIPLPVRSIRPVRAAPSDLWSA